MNREPSRQELGFPDDGKVVDGPINEVSKTYYFIEHDGKRFKMAFEQLSSTQRASFTDRFIPTNNEGVAVPGGMDILRIMQGKPEPFTHSQQVKIIDQLRNAGSTRSLIYHGYEKVMSELGFLQNGIGLDIIGAVWDRVIDYAQMFLQRLEIHGLCSPSDDADDASTWTVCLVGYTSADLLELLSIAPKPLVIDMPIRVSRPAMLPTSSETLEAVEALDSENVEEGNSGIWKYIDFNATLNPGSGSSGQHDLKAGHLINDLANRLRLSQIQETSEGICEKPL